MLRLPYCGTLTTWRTEIFTFERCVAVQQLLTSVFGGLGRVVFACKGTSDSTGGRAHNPPSLSVVDRGDWKEVRTRVGQ